MKKVLYFMMAMLLCLGLTGCFNTPETPVKQPEQIEMVEEYYELDSAQLFEFEDEITEDTVADLGGIQMVDDTIE